jgi:hypothetical protein
MHDGAERERTRPGVDADASRQGEAVVEPDGAARTATPSPSVVVVLGMHRSGTSALTRVLNLLGVELGADLLPPNPDNLTGFWEHTGIYETQERLLVELDSGWDDVRPLPRGWLGSPPAREALSRLGAIVDRDFARTPLWGFKDPRTCRLVPLWRELLAERGLEAGWVLTVRNPLDVAGSLRARDGFPLAKSYLLWLRHLLDAERDTRGARRVFVGYDALLRSWQATVERIAAGLGLSWPVGTPEVAAEVALFLQRALRHQDVGDEVLRDDRLLRLLEPCYLATEAAARDGHEAPLRAVLADAEAEVGVLDELFGPVLSDAEGRRRRAERELARVTAEAEAQATALRAAAHAAALRAERAEHEGGTAQAQVQALEAQLAQSTERAAALREQLESTAEEYGAELTRLRDEIGIRHHRVVALEAAVTALTAVAERPAAPAASVREARTPLGWLPWRVRDRVRMLRGLRAAQKIRESGLFDADWYLERHPEARRRGIDPALHFLLWGAAWKFQPHPLFDTEYYLGENPDLDPERTNPVLHYLNDGAFEGRDPHPLFDSAYYLATNPDVAASRTNPLVHYLRAGGGEGRQPHPLFDSAYYLARRPDVAAAGMNPLVHYVLAGAREGASPHRLFDSAYYLAHNPDVAGAGTDPLRHYLEFGAHESRDPHPLLPGATCTAAAPEAKAAGETPLGRLLRTGGGGKGTTGIPVARVLKLLGPHVRDPGRSGCDAYLAPDPPARSRAGLRLALWGSRRGNYFYGELRDLFAAALRSEGVDPVLLDEDSERPPGVTHDVVMAPHEFFEIGAGRRWRDHPQVGRAVLVSGEQLQTQWFVRSLPLLLRARAVLDINFHTAAVLRELVGLDAHFLPLGWVEGFAPYGVVPRLPDVPALRSLPASVREWDPRAHATLAERPIDVLFVGSVSPRRARLFARMAGGLSDFHAFLHLYSLAGPLVQGSTADLTTEAVSGLGQRAKVLLNVHRDDVPYFEWQRIVLQGMWHGTVVATERSLGVPGFVSGEHYLEADAVDLPEMIAWLLRSPEGRQRAEEISVAARERLRTRFDLRHVVRCLLGRVLAS